MKQVEGRGRGGYPGVDGSQGSQVRLDASVLEVGGGGDAHLTEAAGSLVDTGAAYEVVAGLESSRQEKWQDAEATSREGRSDSEEGVTRRAQGGGAR
eukprot:768031-Hanusia_phi.AAC.5